MAPVIPAKQTTQSIKLSNPVESYAPVYKEDFSSEKTSNLFNKLKGSSTVADIKDSVDETTVSDTANKIFSFGLIGLLAFSIVRLFKRKEPEMKIGLSQSLNDREIEMYRDIKPVTNSYVQPEKPFTTVNYGLNAYQRENRNPYETEVQIHNPRLRRESGINNSLVSVETLNKTQRPVAQTTVTPPPVKKNVTPVNTAPVNQSNPNIENLRFLESMTAIYEKSGRHDLARGLKASLNKNSIQ